MRIECPHCKNKLNLVDVESADSGGSAACPSCGSVIDALEQTVTQKQDYADTVGHFSLIGQVGVGQFGTVWRARDTVLRRTVAVKIPRESELDGSQRDMFLREAQAAAKLTHEGIVRTLEVGEDESGRIFIVSDFINGITLAEKMKQSRLDVKDAAETMRRVAAAVHHAHEHDVIHRDLKPSNILIDVDENPYVSDFGLAKQDTGEVTMTVSGMILGTPAYMSPEQARGHSNKADARSDVYSLGVVLYELLTGEKPFKGSTAVLLHEIQSKDPRLPRSIEKTIPRDLETICLKAMEKRPDHRYQTADELAEDLTRFCSGEPILARRISYPEILLRRARRNRIATLSVLIAFLSVSIAVGMAYRKSQPLNNTLTQPSSKDTDVSYSTLDEHTIMVIIDTEPSGASITFFPRDEYTGEVCLEDSVRSEKTPAEVSLSSGDYFVVTQLPDGRFHEVFRRVPVSVDSIPSHYPHLFFEKLGSSQVKLRKIVIPGHSVTETMVKHVGDDSFKVMDRANNVVAVEQAIPPFYLDTTEVSAVDYYRVMKRLPKYVDRTMVADRMPVRGMFYDDAVFYAERVGKRLPTEFEFEFAATNGGKTRYPWGQNRLEQDVEGKQWELAPVGSFHEDHSEFKVMGLFSNVAEFTASRLVPYSKRERSGLRVTEDYGHAPMFTVRGGHIAEDAKLMDKHMTTGPVLRTGVGRRDPRIRIGFRCARSSKPFGPSQ